jgi:hypothetical protein
MAGTYDYQGTADPEASGWAVGWAAFAATMMLIQGTWWIIAGLIALFNDEFFVVGREYTFLVDVTGWAWVHLLLGILILGAGIALFSGAVWARAVGVILAVIATLIGFGWLPYYPVWGILLIVMSIAVIWALTAHGRDIASMV